jgi:hypothetical protein
MLEVVGGYSGSCGDVCWCWWRRIIDRVSRRLQFSGVACFDARRA